MRISNRRSFLRMLVLPIVMSASCAKEMPATKEKVWLKVKAENVQVSTPSASYREVVFDFTMTSDIAGKDYKNLPLPVTVTIQYNTSKLVFTLPPNEATMRLGMNLIVNNTDQPTGYRIIQATYEDNKIEIIYE